MDFKKYVLQPQLNFIILILLLVSSCLNKNKKLCEGNKYGMFYKFELPAKVTPAVDTFNVGDTIYIENTFSNSLYNQSNGKSYNTNNFDFGLTYFFLDENTSPISGTNNFNVIPIVGTSQIDYFSTGKTVSIKHLFSNNSYQYKAGITFSQAGIYILHFNSFIGNKKLSEQGKSITQCPDENVELSINTNNRIDNNWNMLQFCNDTLFKKVTTQDEFNTGGCYCFYIKP